MMGLVGELPRGGVATLDEVVVPFEELYSCYADPVYRFCFSMLRDAADAEDVAANTFVAAYAAYSRVLPPAAELRPWLFRIARNASVDQLRRRARARRLLGALRRSPVGHSEVERSVVLRDDVRGVVEAMARLRPRDRTLVGLRVAGELAFAEIGAITGMSEQAARTATRRAVARVVADVRGAP